MAMAKTAKTAETAIRKQTVIAELTKSPHGDLNAYRETGMIVAKDDPEFLAHLIAWNHNKGQVRDSKIALPLIAMRHTYRLPGAKEYFENAQAHLALADPRTLVRGLDWARRELRLQNAMIRPVVERYLKEREKKVSWWDKTAIQHRRSMKHLYAWYGVKPSDRANNILFKRIYVGTVFDTVARLGGMDPVAAASAVIKYRIPFLIAKGALGKKLQNVDVLLAVMKRMTPAELITNMTTLESLGVRRVPALRSALEEKLKQTADSRKTSTPTLKTTRAAAAVDDVKLKAKLEAVQEKQLKELQIDGDWLVLGDKSGSMERAIELARMVAATLAKLVKGEVRLTFFDVMPRRFDVTGKSYEQILEQTKGVRADGGTSIGCGLLQAVEEGFEPDGIAIISDGAENNHPAFLDVYVRLVKKLERDIPVYLYRTSGEPNSFSGWMRRAGYEVQEFDLTGKVDYYSLPNLARTMRANRYSLVQEILDTPLRTLDGVFKTKDGDEDEREREKEEA